ncbi:TolC family protein [Sphingomonas sp. DT-207]|uniref:TolC family protein n=1 Tax=Sphingomonas sp. DT-207 TaxID=3396167 RepID=UPI003F199D39
MRHAQLGKAARVIALGVAAGVFGGGVEAREDAVLSIESAVRKVVAWHPNITAAAATLDARSEDVNAARAGYLPQVNVGVGTGYDNRLGSNWRPRPQLSASQMLYDFGKVGSAVDAARAGTRVGRADLLLAIDLLIRETGYAIVEVQRNAAIRQTAEEQLVRIREISTLVGHRFAKGATTRSDTLQAQSRVAAAEATLAQIDAEQRRWMSNLQFLLGMENDVIDVTAEVPEWLMQSCTHGVGDWANVPTVMRADAQRERATAELRRSRADRLPTVTLSGDAAPDVVGPFSSRSTYSFGLSVTSNVFGGNATRARVRSADYALAAAEAAAQQARNEASQRLAEAQQQIASLNRLLETLLARQADMAETGKLYRLQYLEMGTRTLVDLLNAEQELQQARFDAINTAHDLRRLELDCLYYSGRSRDAFGLAGTRAQGVTL